MKVRIVEMPSKHWKSSWEVQKKHWLFGWQYVTDFYSSTDDVREKARDYANKLLNPVIEEIQ